MDECYPRTMEGLCRQIRALIQQREAGAMGHRRPAGELIREAEELRRILRLVRQAYAMAVPDWRSG